MIASLHKSSISQPNKYMGNLKILKTKQFMMKNISKLLKLEMNPL